MATKIHGLGSYKQKLRRMRTDVADAALDSVEIAAETVRTGVVSDLRRQGAPALGTSVVMPRGLEEDKSGAPRGGNDGGSGQGRVRDHVPSEPFTPPNTDRGVLVNSYGTHVDHRQFQAFTGSNNENARRLENGTRRMLPRPHLRPRYFQELPRFVKRFRTRVGKAIRRNR